MKVSPVILSATVTVGLTAAAGSLAAQGQGEVELPRLSSPVRVDGELEDSAWAAITPLPLTMYTPAFRGAPTQRTEIRVAYDDEYLYAAGWFFDSSPRDIRINSLYRDRWSGDDAFAILIDPFNDNESGLWFYTNPAGVRMDQSISDDAKSYNESWNGVWDVATRVSNAGWFAELRIPLATLGFQERDGRVVMGLTATRLLARHNERVTFPAIDPRFEFRQPSVMQDVVLRGVIPRRPVYLTPYLLSGVDRTSALPAGATAYANDEEFVREAGVDLRYGVSESFHLDLSANTDFAQVEADDEQVNLTRFPLFFPEKRQFFQERANLFDFDFSEGGRLFHSRQIGLAPDRTPIRMLGGARVVARTGGWDVAVLDVQTGRRDAFPTENLGVARVKHRVINPFSSVGAVLTTRAPGDGGYNVGSGVDGWFRMFGNDYLTLRGAATFDDSIGRTGLLRRSQVYADWERRSSRGLGYRAQLNRAGADYLPGLGFLPRRDFTRLSLYSTYSILNQRSVLRSHGPGLIGYFYWRNSDQALETSYVGYWWNYGFRSGAEGWLEGIQHYENVAATFDLGNGVSVEPGVYRFHELWFNYQPPPGPRLRTLVDARIGGFYDGSRMQLRLEPTWNLSRFLEVGGSYTLNRIRFSERNTGLDIHLARLRLGAAANARLSAVALVQLNSVDDHVGVNLRLRYNFSEGSDLWVVYDERFNTERDAADGMPQLPLSEARALRVKLTHTFVPCGVLSP